MMKSWMMSFIVYQAFQVCVADTAPRVGERQNLTLSARVLGRALSIERKTFNPGPHIVEKNETGSILSPGFGVRNYPKGVNQRWSFETSDNCLLVLNCLSVNIGYSALCQDDYLHVSDHNKIDQRFCGNNIPTGPLVSTSGDFQVIFHSSVKSNSDLGFACVLKCKDLNSTSPIPDVPDVTPGPELPDKNSPDVLDCTCGKSLQISGRVVGGVEVEIGKYPWMVGLVFKNQKRPFCGAALINDRYVMTAAHCVMGLQNQEEVELLLREHNYFQENEVLDQPTIRASISKIISHPEFSKRNINGDIALLKLTTPLSLAGAVKQSIVPVCLPELANRILGKNLTVTGWGVTVEGGTYSSFLRETDVTVMPHSHCRKAYAGIITITDRMICAASQGGERDACKGDSGGPLVLKNQNGYYEEIGLVSFGFGCARKEYPGIYTRISGLLTWIEDNTEDARWCRKI